MTHKSICTRARTHTTIYIYVSLYNESLIADEDPDCMPEWDEEGYYENGNTTASLSTLLRSSTQENTSAVWSNGFRFYIQPQLPGFEKVSKVLVPLHATSSELDCFSVSCDSDVSKCSLWASWSTVTLHEMNSFFLIVIHMYLVSQPRITDYWSTDVMLDSSFAGKITTTKKDKFCSIYFIMYVNDDNKYNPTISLFIKLNQFKITL